MPTSYTDVFGGSTVYPSEVSYYLIETAVDVTLYWPLEAEAGQPLAASIIDVETTVAGVQIIMPDATDAGLGTTILYNNVGDEDFTVHASTGVQILSIAPGEQWQIYLIDNSTEAGTWRSLQYGASVSAADAATLAGTGLRAVGLALQQEMPIVDFNANYSMGVNDNAFTFVWTSNGAGTLELPDPGEVLDGWFVAVRNAGGGALTVSRSGVDIDGGSSRTFDPGASAFIVTDGTEFWTLAYNGGTVNNFDYTVIAVGGTGDYTLTGSELNRIAYRFTGVLTGNRNIIVPAVAQQYWVDNQTSGAYDLTVKTSAGSGIVVASGSRRILYCDGTDVVDADTSNLSVPIAVAQGGTGSTTASGARINLGGTSVGIAVFTAASASAARTAIGAGTVGDQLFTSVTTSDAWGVLGPCDGGTF